MNILRHLAECPVDGAPVFDETAVRAVAGHVEANLGPIAWVACPLPGEAVEVAILVVAPRSDRSRYTLVTAGMSAAPMRIQCPHGVELRYAEVLMTLSPTWPLDRSFGPTPANWPFHLLHDLACLPHRYDTWLGAGHTWCDGDPPLRIGDTRFTGAVLLPPLTLGRAFPRRVAAGAHKTIELLEAWPLYPEEVEYKLRSGLTALLRRMTFRMVPDVTDPRRRNTCAGTRSTRAAAAARG